VQIGFGHATLGVPGVDPLCGRSELARQVFFVVGKGSGEVHEVVAYRRTDRLQPRQQIEPNPVAEEIEITVRTVLPPREITIGEPGSNVRTIPGQERPNDAVAGRNLDARQGAGTAAAKKLDHDALSDVIAVVTGGHGGKSPVSLEVDQGAIPEPSPGSFATLRERGAGIDTQEMERHAKLIAQSLAERGITIGFDAADAVVHVDRLDGESETLVTQKVEQRDRVRSTRERHQDPFSDQL
jgi:hypothetical protein